MSAFKYENGCMITCTINEIDNYLIHLNELWGTCYLQEATPKTVLIKSASKLSLTGLKLYCIGTSDIMIEHRVLPSYFDNMMH